LIQLLGVADLMRLPASRSLKRLLWVVVLIAALLALALSFVLEHIGVPPRSLAPYVERRSSGHNPFIVRTGQLMSRVLIAADRGNHRPATQLQLRIGAETTAAPQSGARLLNGSRTLLVSSSDEAIKAIAEARPGDVITFLPGKYRFSGRALDVLRAGTSENRITVRAANLDSVFLEFNMVEGFHVHAPYWTFENLNIQGICSDHSSCEHVFHIVGNATHSISKIIGSPISIPISRSTDLPTACPIMV
jgi:hypothetical protein